MFPRREFKAVKGRLQPVSEDHEEDYSDPSGPGERGYRQHHYQQHGRNPHHPDDPRHQPSRASSPRRQAPLSPLTITSPTRTHGRMQVGSPSTQRVDERANSPSFQPRSPYWANVSPGQPATFTPPPRFLAQYHPPITPVTNRSPHGDMQQTFQRFPNNRFDTQQSPYYDAPLRPPENLPSGSDPNAYIYETSQRTKRRHRPKKVRQHTEASMPGMEQTYESMMLADEEFRAELFRVSHDPTNPNPPVIPISAYALPRYMPLRPPAY